MGYDHLAWSKSYNIRAGSQECGSSPLPLGWDVNINVIRGKVDFFSILQNNNLGLEDYYDFLNLGVKVTATASTDYPAPVVGEEATYAYVGTGGFTPDAWFDAVKLRTAPSSLNGPMVTLTVGDAMPGDEVAGGENAPLRPSAQAWAPGIDWSPEGARNRGGRAGDPRGAIDWAETGQACG